MISTVVMVYLGAWALTAVGTFFVGRLLTDPNRPADNPVLVSLAAGAVWPLVLLGAVELSSVAVYAAATSPRTPQSVPGSWLQVDTVKTASPLR